MYTPRIFSDQRYLLTKMADKL